MSTLAGVGLAGIGLAGSLMGKKKKATVDVAGMTNLVKGSSGKQRNLINQQFSELQPMSQDWEAKRQGLSESIQPGFDKIGKDLLTGYQQVGQAEQQNLENILRTRQQQSARNIPLQQQLIRENLAASGGFRTGGAARSLQAPVMQAQTEQADLASALSQQAQAAQTGRLEKGTETQANLAKEALTTKLGIDEDTMNTLFQTGRTDIIERLGALRGVESDELQSMLGIMGLKTQADLANAAASNANRQALYGSLTGLGGQLIGAGIAKGNKENDNG
jgi:hypothetical protein